MYNLFKVAFSLLITKRGEGYKSGWGELPWYSFQQDTLLTLRTSSPPWKRSSVLQADCVRACPALPATEMSIYTVMSSGILIPRKLFTRR